MFGRGRKLLTFQFLLNVEKFVINLATACFSGRVLLRGISSYPHPHPVRYHFQENYQKPD
jgi:hypothetical protein